MPQPWLSCPNCTKPLPPPTQTGEVFFRCTQCGDVEALIFPAWFAPPPAVQRGERLIDETASSCFYHAMSKAESPCDACGRFLCALCMVELDREILCPACIESGRRKGSIKKLIADETNWDSIALVISAVGALTWILSPLATLAVLYFTIRYWNTPRQGIIPRSRIKFYAALLLTLGMDLVLLVVWGSN